MKTVLSTLVCSRTRAEIFRLLFGLNAAEYHLRNIARQSGFAVGTVRQDLRKLLSVDLVVARRDGNRLYYRANRSHPLFADIHNLTIKTSGLVEVLAEAIGGKGIRAAFVFGSIAVAEAGAFSDIDLMVIGDISLRDLSKRLSGMTERLGREINPHVLSVSEYVERKRSGEHFLTNVLSSTKMFVVGSADELEELG